MRLGQALLTAIGLSLAVTTGCGPETPARSANAPLATSSAPAPPPQPRQHPHQHRGGVHHRFQNAEQWAKVFDDPKRDAWQKPDDVIRELQLASDSVVADLGAGTGYFSVRLAKALPAGKVIAIDIEPELLEHLRARGQKLGLENLTPQLAEPNDPKLAEDVDRILVVDTYHHITDRSQYFAKLRPRLKPGGRLVIVDFKPGDIPVGPPEQYRIPPDAVERELSTAGYQRCGSYDGLPYQYMLKFAAGGTGC